MYGEQGNYTYQFRQPLTPPPPPSYQQTSPSPASPFLEAPSGLMLQPVSQAPLHFGRLVASEAQTVQFPHPSVNSTQPYFQLPPSPRPPTQVYKCAPAVPPYPLAGLPVLMPLPPPPRILQPTPLPDSHSPRQVLYHTLHLPHLGIIQAPPLPQWLTDVPNPPTSHPPPPPSPPPPPPSSPPPLPPTPPAPTPALEVFPSDSVEVLSSDSKAVAIALKLDNAPVHLVDASKSCSEGNRVSLVDGKASENLSLPPPMPDEAVVRSIEVLCQFILENIARAKEVGNPQLSFLFGGEPGSAAAIGHDYFQWIKKKCVAVMEFPKDHKAKITPKSTLTADVSSQTGDLERVDLAHSPVTSDMDIEDDITPTSIHKSYSNTNEESIVSTQEGSYAFENVEEQFHAKTTAASGTSSPIDSHMDIEDEKESLVFEDASPQRGSPDTSDLEDGTHAPSRFSTGYSLEGKVLMNTEDVRSEEAFKYGSPFRLIQDYASAKSDENVKSDLNPMSLSPATTTVTSSMQQEKKQSELCSDFCGQDVTAVANETGYNTTLCQLSGHSLEDDALEGGKMHADQANVELHSKQSLMEKQPSYDLDEFGRLMRKGSDSDESEYRQRHGKRGRRSRRSSFSSSPHGSRRHRRCNSRWSRSSSFSCSPHDSRKHRRHRRRNSRWSRSSSFSSSPRSSRRHRSRSTRRRSSFGSSPQCSRRHRSRSPRSRSSSFSSSPLGSWRHRSPSPRSRSISSSPQGSRRHRSHSPRRSQGSIFSSSSQGSRRHRSRSPRSSSSFSSSPQGSRSHRSRSPRSSSSCSSSPQGSKSHRSRSPRSSSSFSSSPQGSPFSQLVPQMSKEQISPNIQD